MKQLLLEHHENTHPAENTYTNVSNVRIGLSWTTTWRCNRKTPWMGIDYGIYIYICPSSAGSQRCLGGLPFDRPTVVQAPPSPARRLVRVASSLEDLASFMADCFWDPARAAKWAMQRAGDSQGGGGEGDVRNASLWEKGPAFFRRMPSG